jgi:hypothetical protein
MARPRSRVGDRAVTALAACWADPDPIFDDPADAEPRWAAPFPATPAWTRVAGRWRPVWARPRAVLARPSIALARPSLPDDVLAGLVDPLATALVADYQSGR